MKFIVKYRFLLLSVIIIGLFVSYPVSDVLAQCPMCRIGAETNMAGGGTAGNGLNKGILLLLSLPYLIVGVFAYMWWKNKPKAVHEA